MIAWSCTNNAGLPLDALLIVFSTQTDMLLQNEHIAFEFCVSSVGNVKSGQIGCHSADITFFKFPDTGSVVAVGQADIVPVAFGAPNAAKEARNCWYSRASDAILSMKEEATTCGIPLLCIKKLSTAVLFMVVL